MERPTVDNGGKGYAMVQLDGGDFTSGTVKAKVEVVFQIPYNTLTQMITAEETVHGSFILDAWGPGPGHTITQIIAGKINGLTDILGLMYGVSSDNANKFDVNPINLLPRTFYAMSMEWRPVGGQCIGKYRFNVCPDQASPATCRATALAAENTSGAGECPTPVTLVNLGQRYDATEPTSAWIHHVRVDR
jgi:hypothetical protein